MFVIDFHKNNYHIYIEDEPDPSTFKSDCEYLKRRQLFFNKYDNSWLLPPVRIDEMIIWFEKGNKKYSVTDEAIEQIEKLEEIFSEESKISKRARIDKSILNEGIKLYDFQEEGILWRLKRECYADWDDAGLGKTIQNIIVFSQRYKEDKTNGILIICPNGLQYHWKYEILKFVNVFKEEDIITVYNTNKIKIFDEHKETKIFIIADHLIADVLLSYRKDWDKIKKKSKKKLRWNSSVNIHEVWDKENLSIIIDESHSIKHSDTIKTKSIFSIKNQSKYRATLSATPFINKIEDAWTQMTFVDKSIIGLSEKAFKVDISKSIGDNYGVYNIKSYNTKHVKEYLEKFKEYSIKRLKEDVPEMKAKKFPPKKLALELSKHQEEIYRIVTEEELAILDDEFDTITWRQILNKLPVMIEAIDNPLLLRKREYNNNRLTKLIDSYDIEKDPKFIAFKTLVENYVDYQQEKIVVYAFHPKTLDMLHEKFKKYNPLIIHGSLKEKDKDEYRQKVQDDFNTKDKHKIVFLSSLTSSAGINLQHGSNHVIFYELDYDSTHYRQAQDRTHRITSIKDTTIDILYYPNTLDNVRVSRAIARSDFNDRLNKEISEKELRSLLYGIL